MHDSPHCIHSLLSVLTIPSLPHLNCFTLSFSVGFLGVLGYAFIFLVYMYHSDTPPSTLTSFIIAYTDNL